MRNFVFFIAIALLFSGCFKKEISCSDATVKDLVHELSQDQAIDTIALKQLENNKSAAPIMLLIGMSCPKANSLKECFKNLELVDAISSSKESLVAKLKKSLRYDEVAQKVKNAPFSLEDILTQSKDKELQKVQCKAIATYTVDNKPYRYNVEYDAQYTDDGKKVYVELKNIALRESE